jgi:WhiB family redox-sensing transcriptional regulator
MTQPHLPTPPEWTRDALCAQTDPDAWFPEKGDRNAAALAVCNGIPGGRPPCPVREKCLKYALDNDERWGIWAGTTQKDRQRMRSAT